MKKQTILALSVMTLSCILFNTGCAESKNDSSTTTLRTTAFEGAQGNCNNGGVKLEVLVDGVVDDAQTQYICNGANGQSERDIHNALVATSDEVGETCANGGIHMDFGLDANDNGTLDASEILGSRAICHGTNGENGENGQTATIHTTAFEDVQGGCNYGGIKAEVLIDNVVQADQTQYICNGANGQNGQDGRDGQDGHIALVMSSDEVGDHCSNGGIRLDFGLDTNDNGQLDHEEILSFHYICNGSNGLDGQNGQDGTNGTNGTNANIVTTVFEGEQGSCMNGGVKIDVLIDGVIQAGKTQYICNGANGQNGQNSTNTTVQTTPFEGAQGSCTNGGVKIDVLVDGVILPRQTQYICNGANGTNGQDGQNGTNGSNATLQTTSFTGAQGSCTNGGVKVDVLIDGVVQTGQTKYICNGVNGADGQDGQNGTNGTNGSNATIQTTAFTGAQGTCTNGGVKVDVLVDGVLQPGQTQYICNGTSGGNPCVTGKWFDGDACQPDNAEHCRGIDCTTTVSHWGDGICTESGECKVTSCAGDTHIYDDNTNYICEENTVEHCGAHTTACDEDSECVNGECTSDNTQICDGVTTDVLTDIDNCGTCGNACAYGLDCINGKCLGNINCGGTTYNISTNLDHCGKCNHRCSDGTTCVTGECVVAPGRAYCGAQTVQLNTLSHCESCDACADGLLCRDNKCVVGQGKMICNNVIIDSRSDSANCGECGKVCQSGFECVNSSCKRISSLTSSTTITCNAQTVKPYNDRLNCAGCNLVCANYYYCKEAYCAILPSIGSIITFGSYEQDNNTSNGKEPIEWRVLDQKSDGQLLIISEKVLDVKPYNTTFISITWEKSTIRSWLNGYAASYNTVGIDYTNDNFIDTAFTAEEKAKIVISPSNILIKDKLFLLSIYEAETTGGYFTSHADAQADATRYAIKKGVRVRGSESGSNSSDGSCADIHCYASWWLRSQGSSDSRDAAYVDPSGLVYRPGMSVQYNSYGVRPALWMQF